MSLELSAPKLSQKLLDQGFEARLLSVPCPFFEFPLRMRQLHNAPLLCFVLQTVTMNDWDNKKDRGTQLYIEPLHNSTRSATASICTSKHCNSSAIVMIFCKRLCDDDQQKIKSPCSESAPKPSNVHCHYCPCCSFSLANA